MSEFKVEAVNAVNALKCELADEVLRSSGRLRLRVTGWSMLPAIWPGDILMLEQSTCQEVSEGDIVLFRRDRRLFAHRVLGKVNGVEGVRIFTQGDGMPHPDPPAMESELLGRVSFISRNGERREPKSRLRLSQRAVAALVSRSASAARIFVGLHNMLHRPEEQVSPCQS